ncbi:uncharacterized protein pdzph1 [Lepisosteus oculatus]
MSKRRRRNSKRRKSSSSTKYSHSPFQFQYHSSEPINKTTEYENDRTSAEKGETDTAHRENFVLETDDEEESEPHFQHKNKRFSHDTLQDHCWNKDKHTIPPPDEENIKGVKITTSVTIDDQELLTSGKIIFQQSHEPTDREKINKTVTVTTTKVKYTVSNLKVEIKEVLHSDDPDVKSTFTVKNKEGKRTKTCVSSQWNKCPSPNNDVHNQPCSVNTNINSTIQSQDNRNQKRHNFNLSITEINTNFAETAKNSIECEEDTEWYKGCCEDLNNNKYRLHNHQLHRDYNDIDYQETEGSCSLYTLSDCSLHWTEHSAPETLCKEVVSEIPPPHEFADEDETLIDDLTGDMASCEIGNCYHSGNQAEAATALGGFTSFEGTRYVFDTKCQDSLDSEQSPNAENLSECDNYDPLLMGPKMPMSRSSFTKHFIHNHEGKTWMRNNSIAILESKPISSCYFEQQSKRRKTFPETADCSNKMQDSLPLYRESISSGTLSSFFMKTLPLQSGRSGRFYLEDERPFKFCAERRKSSENGTCHNPGRSAFSIHKAFPLNPSLSGKSKNPFYPSESEESTDEVFAKFGHHFHEECKEDEETVILESNSEMNSCKDIVDGDCYRIGTIEQGEFTESGFDEEMVDVDDHNLELSGDFHITRKDLLIHVTPPSRSSSIEYISDKSHVSTPLNGLEDITEIPESNLHEKENPDLEPKKRRGSVMTVIIGDSEQRFIQNDNKPQETSVPERNHRDSLSTVYNFPSVSPILDVDEMEADSNGDSHVEVKLSCQSSLALETSMSNQALAEVLEEQVSTGPAEGSQEISTNTITLKQTSEQCDVSPLEEDLKENEKTEKEDTMTVPETCGPSSDLCKKKLQKEDSAEKPSGPKSPQDKKTEVRKHLKPPADPVLKDTRAAESVQEDESDHWAKRRKLFKESKQWSSAGGSSITSNITEESVNSEDTRSVDLAARENEDKGFYTETFHSASWIYRGDDVSPNDSPRCLSKRPRPVAIRERTVRITKGMGDYPWGFRIQFSKPILVTEVDTNGAAEEAGLLVGDIVMTVNGTDVTSVPHSEAADLARQGPDTLTLVIGSDISRCPNTPRPACRGYLHKRTQSGFLKGWRKRWFVLKHDGCLYYYKNKKDEGKCRALESMKLEGAEVGPDTSLGKPFVFKCCPVSGNRVYYYCATSNQEMKRWLEAMERAVHPITQNHVWVDVSRHNASLPPLAIKNPECLGLLHQMDKNKDVWVQHYCILKDGCLYFYTGIRSTHALGGIYLHGYIVSEQPFGSRRSTIELKPPSEEFKTFYLSAENAAENKRWILALRASINKWLPLHQAIQDFMNRPPEETRM